MEPICQCLTVLLYRSASRVNGFSPFEQTVQGPMKIQRHLWTKEDPEEEVRNSYQYVFDLRERMKDTLRTAREELERAQ